MKEDDSRWPQKNKDGRQELEIRLGSDHIQFEVRFIWRQRSKNKLTDSRPRRLGLLEMLQTQPTQKDCGCFTTWCKT